MSHQKLPMSHLITVHIGTAVGGCSHQQVFLGSLPVPVPGLTAAADATLEGHHDLLHTGNQVKGDGQGRAFFYVLHVQL